MRVRGHTLVWHAQNPPWLEGRLTSPSVATAILEDHIARVVGHFRGAVHEWDVVNEVVGPVDGSLRDTPWLRAIGPGYIELAFRLAHEADPAAKLYLNDFLLERSGPKLDGVVALVADLKANGAPIDGVGVQAHAACLSDCGGWFDELATSLRRIADLGVDVAITELDVGIPLPSTPNELRGQAQIYASAVDACLAVPRCRTIVMWGFTDRYSWVPSEFPGLGDALPFDDLYRPKPAYWALNEHLRMRGARRRRLATPLSAPAAPPARDAADAGSSPRATPCGASP
jgi:endo-1,4-beta-xylanase